MSPSGEDKDILIWAFRDAPVRIMWIERSGKVLEEQTLTFVRSATNSATPRTDALVAQIQSTSPNNYDKVDAQDEYAYTRREFEMFCSHARQLERELTEAKKPDDDTA